MIWLIVKFFIFIFILVQAGAWLVKILSRISSYFRVSYFAVAFMIMAVATSIPELLVGINSALDNMPQLTLGVVLGSNIADMALVFGVALIVAKQITLESIIARRDVYYMALVTILPIFLIVDSYLSRIDGIILLIVFVLFSYHVFWSKQRFLKEFKADKKSIGSKITNLLKDFIWFAICIAILIISAKYVVDYGELLAINLNIPLLLVGISVLAFSTSLPELVFEIKAIKSGNKDMALGDLVGSIVTNSGLVLGITAIISPFEISNYTSFIIAVLYLAILLLFFTLNTSKPLSRTIGYLLVISYIIFLIIEFYR